MVYQGLFKRNRNPVSRLKKIDGIEHKLCAGPSHKKPEWIPLKDFYRRVHYKGKATRCKDCHGHYTGTTRWIRTSRVRFIFVELIHRLGVMEAARRSGLDYKTITELAYDPHRLRVRKSSVKKGIEALRVVREQNIVRHKDSIRIGAYLRGQTEKVPTDRRDLYKSHGDDETESAKRYRAERV